jgi:hypothetical protein
MAAGSHRSIIRSALVSAAFAAGLAFTGDALAQSSTAAKCGVITYCGGPVISNVQIVPVFWSDQVNPQITGWAEGYLSGLANSELLDMLSEYSTAGKTGEACGMAGSDGGLSYFGPTTPFSTNQTITRGTALPAVTITPTNTSTNIADDNAAIGTELVSQIAAGKLPAPTYDKQGYPNTLYFVFFPSNISITLQNGGSCSAFGGYHYSVTYTASKCTGQYIPYAVIPDCGGGTSGLPDVCSHELAEAISDVDVGPTTPATANYGDGAWYLGPTNPCNAGNGNSCPSNCGEVGDVCQTSGDNTVPGTQLVSQNIWSQAQSGSCAVNNPNLGTQAAPSGPPITSCSVTTPPVDAGGPTPEAGTPPGDSGAPHGDAGSHGDAGGIGPGGDAGTSPQHDGGGPVTGPSSDDGGANGDNPFPVSSSSGCGCTTAPGLPGGAGVLASLALLGLVARRGKRR